jgi:Flp pilus assembly protein TadG
MWALIAKATTLAARGLETSCLHWRKGIGGNVVMTVALGFPALLAATGAGLDYANISSRRANLQAVADTSALAGASEFRIGTATAPMISQVVQNYAQAELGRAGTTATVTPQVDTVNRAVSVAIAADVPTVVMQFFGSPAVHVAVRATANMRGGDPVCFVGLDAKANQTLLLDNNARLQAPSCALYSNSTKPNGLMAKANATVQAAFICSGGGKSSPGPGSFAPAPQTDCPIFPDPLAQRPAPPVGGCTQSNLVVNGGLMTLFPGTYCGGITVTNLGVVTMAPGIYVIKDGPLYVTGGGSLTGTGVGLYFTGANAVVNFDTNSIISLMAPVTGLMAGLLMFEDRAAPQGEVHQILSNNAHVLLGTIYLSRNRLHVAANASIADQAAYTVVIVNQFTLSQGPTMVLNTNYGGTNVPVPVGVGPGGTIALTQ